MKLELKHLAPYLPYGLQFLKYNQIHLLSKLDYTDNELWLVNYGFLGINSNITKPILRPLSDLTEDLLCISWIEHIRDNGLCTECPYEVWKVLFKNHFDVFGLIEKGLAIDINTI